MTVDMPGRGGAAQRGTKKPLVEEEGDVRPKNQITIPKAVVQALGIHPGDRLVFVVNEGEQGQMHVYRVPPSFAGIAPHAYGGPQEGAKYVDDEREAWTE
jgi:AbrB family looped-hinge helix DNA binding protein